MSLSEDENQAVYQIRAVQPGLIKINDKIFTHSLIISPSQLIEEWSPIQVSDLTAEHLEIIKTLNPDILIIGTGETLQFPKLEVYGSLINQGIGVEIMSTSAACRTYNVLSSENRNVVAALIIDNSQAN